MAARFATAAEYTDENGEITRGRDAIQQELEGLFADGGVSDSVALGSLEREHLEGERFRTTFAGPDSDAFSDEPRAALLLLFVLLFRLAAGNGATQHSG